MITVENTNPFIRVEANLSLLGALANIIEEDFLIITYHGLAGKTCSSWLSLMLRITSN